ncbi:efflux transporter outer membrane subunit [uncultured Paludibaculum sp.]|uniref:efflux transporter outer membrane subunit n=1 Tax=uncultured Paludibaculum sp. TaxID=1765020 RepID=UPI002AABF751|nr:efflux transporter outer membrane subunit [uncultured Paludibaculum sp.]
MTRRFAVLVTVALLLLAGCAVGPKYRAPVVKTPEAFSQVQERKPAADMAALADWWRTFHDQKLSSLVERAINSNLDVKVAKARLQEARATFKNTQASKRLPAGNANFNYARSRTSSDNPQIPKLGGGTLIPTTYSSYQSYLDASYELDLFGGVKHQIEAASADAQSYEDSLRNTLVSAVAEVSRDYLQLRQYQEQLAVARRTEATRKDTLKITEVRYKAGLVTDLDVANAAASLAQTQATIPTLEASASQMVHAISVLLGENPAALAAELNEASGIPASPNEIPVGLPSDLLRRRPDIRQAERSLAAATARVGVQVASLFPSISLTAQYGGQTGEALHLANAAARFYSLGPQIKWGLLNYPATKANIRTYEARRDQQYLTYQKTVLTAFQDVENALASHRADQQRLAALEQQVSHLQKAAAVAMNRYTHGLTNFLDVLDAQRSLNTAEDSAVQSRAAVNIDLVSVYKALGGGWEQNDPVADNRSGRRQDVSR